jgi:hypothetical protein
MSILIGSSAIKYHFPDFPRQPKDEDFIGEGKSTKEKEYLTNKILQGYSSPVLSKDYLYTLKVSHVVGWDINWDKHIWDIQWLKERGCKLHKPLFFDLYNYWNEVHGINKRSDLEMTSEEFFDNAIQFPVDHDKLHEILITHPYFESLKPTYTEILKDGAEVAVDEGKFNQLSFHKKFNLVFEEVAVMSVERYPDLFYKEMYKRMLKKFILNHAPLWEAIWVVENHKYLLTNIPFNFKEFLWKQSGLKN